MFLVVSCRMFAEERSEYDYKPLTTSRCDGTARTSHLSDAAAAVCTPTLGSEKMAPRAPANLRTSSSARRTLSRLS